MSDIIKHQKKIKLRKKEIDGTELQGLAGYAQAKFTQRYHASY
jgi:hypothetical protein